MSTSSKILVSMIAYRERYLAESVRDCWEKADYPERLLFSVVSEQHLSELHANLDFIPADQIIYRKYDLSEYRGVLWSRSKTTDVSFEYDYILFTCGHNKFAQSWDSLVIEEHHKATEYSDKAILTFAAPELFYDSNGNAILESDRGKRANHFRGKLDETYVPGYGWSSQKEVPQTNDVVEEIYLQYSWVFGPKKYVDEVPLDPDINYHAEEIYMTIQTWCRGWRMFATPVIMYYHDTEKRYPGEDLSRMDTHRPWSDINKDAFWAQSDASMIKLNQLLSGTLEGKFGGISSEHVKAYCNFSGLNPKWCEPNPNYNSIKLRRHAEDFRDMPAFQLY